MSRPKITLQERIILLIESLAIITFFFLTLFELYSVLMMYSNYIDGQSKYYFYLIHNRLQMKYFNAYIASRNPKDTCPYHPPPEDNSPIRLAYQPRQIISIGTINNANPVDVTSSTFVYDNFHTHYIQNNKNAQKKYFEFELQSAGTSTLNLMTNYIFNIWKGVHVCALQLYYNDPRAYHLIPKPNYTETVVNEWCKKFTKDPSAQACGVYFDTYMTCSLVTYTSVNDSLRGDSYDSSYWADQGWTCPFNYFDMNFDPNPNYNSSDPTSKKIDGREYMQFVNMNSADPSDPSYEKYNSVIDKYLLYDLDNAYLGDYQHIEHANDTLNFAVSDATVYTVGKPYAFKDAFNGIWDTYTFVDFYNDTYFDKPVHNPATNTTTYLPNFFLGPDDRTFYRPVDSHKNKINVSLTYWGQPTVSKECFEQYIDQQGKYQWLVELSNLQTTFLDDSLPLLLAWLCVKIFISMFWQISIRLTLIYEKLTRGYNFPADVKADFPTKYTSKIVGIIMFALLFNGVYYQHGYFSNIIQFTIDLVGYDCYPDPLIISSIREYRYYIQRLLDSNNNFSFSLWVSFILEIISVVWYTIDYYIQRRNEIEEEMILKKEN